MIELTVSICQRWPYRTLLNRVAMSLRYLPLGSLLVGLPTRLRMIVRMPCSLRANVCAASLS